MSVRDCSFLLVCGVACAFDSSGQNSAGDETTSSSGDGTSTASPTTTATTATTAMTSDDTDTTTATATTDPDSSGTSPATTDDPTSETSDDSESTAPSGCAVDNGGCDPDATCNDDGSNFACTCNAGFVGPGTVCATTPVMQTLRADLPCVGGDCAGGATCTTAGNVDDQVVMVGEDGVVYGVQLAVRGVLEHKEYANGDCDGQWCIGGDPDPSPWNAVTIIVSDPPGEYHPNAGEGGVFEVFAVEEERTVAIAAGATITIEIDGNGVCSIENVDDIVIPGVPPDPAPFDGQFLQLDLVGATIAG